MVYLLRRTRIARRFEVSGGLNASSGFADLRSGTCRGCIVARKALRVTAGRLLEDEKGVCHRWLPRHGHSAVPLQQFCKEVVPWRTLHLNTLKPAEV